MMHLLILQLILFCPLGVHLQPHPTPTSTTARKTYIPYPEDKYVKLNQNAITKKEVGAILQMTVEFLKDMDTKMRDVNRVEKMYRRSFDFGSGKLYQQLESIFDHMQKLYKDTSDVRTLFKDRIASSFSTVLPNAVKALQIMLGDYMEFLGVTDVYKERYHYYKSSSKLWDVRSVIAAYLKKRTVYPYAPDRDGK